MEACFSGQAFSRHRHDTYAIGITVKGVQSFDYRGATRHSQPGQLFILHPDEPHDGRAGDGAAFRYRTAYIAPSHIQTVLGGRRLPFVADGVSGDAKMAGAVLALVGDLERPLCELEYEDALYDLALALEEAAGVAAAIGPANRSAALCARDYIDARIGARFSLDDLERVTGHDRWRLSRDFRAMFGASPYRYLTLRRLERARAMMVAGDPIAEAAVSCGFSDQSHLGRQFRKTYGLTPNGWLIALRRAHDHSIPPMDDRTD